MLQELSDRDLEMVTGAISTPGTGNISVNTTVNSNLSIVYAPVTIAASNISNSNIDNGNKYIQASSIRH
jgi:hypothetical protein